MQTSQYKAFEGPNGWYVAIENESGFHHQPDGGGTLTREQAERDARRLNTPSETAAPCVWGCDGYCSHERSY